MAITIKLRRDTSANWSSVNPVLAEGEVGVETNTNRMKVGNGTLAWNALDYMNVTPGDAVSTITGGSGVSVTGASDNPTVAVDNTVVRTSGTQTIGGVKTLSSIPVLPSTNPTTDNQAVRKAYVDAQVSGINTGVASVGAGAGIVIGGTPSAPTVAIAPNVATTDGINVFSIIPSLPGTNPIGLNEATRKGYVDSVAVPIGGTTGQVLAKSSNTDRAVGWIDPPAGFDPLTYSPVVIGEGAAVGSVTNPQFRTAVGHSAQAMGISSSAFGHSADATGNFSAAFGQGAQASVDTASAFGQGARASRIASTAVGHDAYAAGFDSSAFGTRARTDDANPLRIKYGMDRTLNYSTDEEALWTATDSTESAGSGTRRYHPHSEEIIRIKNTTPAEYASITPKDPATLYVDNSGLVGAGGGGEEYGAEWTARSAAQANDWTSVTYGNGLFVAVSQNGTNRVMASPDGVNWTARNAAEANQWRSVTYGNGLFVAVASNGTNRVMTSQDGITAWTARTAAANNQWYSVTYGNGLFVAVASSGVNRVMTSPDGVNWTARAAAGDSDWESVAYGNGMFVAVAVDGTNQVMTSPDGINWTARTAAANNMWTSVTYGNGLFVAVSSNGTNRVMTSPDGVNWTARSAENSPWVSVTHGNGLFVAVSYTGTNRVMTSPDGITWTARTAAEASYWCAVTYGNGLFVAIAYMGTNLVMTSNNLYTTGDGITKIVALTQAGYDALATKDPNTLYVVTS